MEYNTYTVYSLQKAINNYKITALPSSAKFFLKFKRLVKVQEKLTNHLREILNDETTKMTQFFQ